MKKEAIFTVAVSRPIFHMEIFPPWIILHTDIHSRGKKVNALIGKVKIYTINSHLPNFGDFSSYNSSDQKKKYLINLASAYIFKSLFYHNRNY